MFKMFNTSRVKVFTYLSIISFKVFIFDFITKLMVERYIAFGASFDDIVNGNVVYEVEVIKNFFYFVNARNTGVVFGFFHGNSRVFNFFTIAGIISIIYITDLVWKSYKEMKFYNLLAYGFILGGALGNTFDRVYRGFVIDFIDFRGIWPYVFNIADFFVCLGATILALESAVMFIASLKKDKNESKDQEEN